MAGSGRKDEDKDEKKVTPPSPMTTEQINEKFQEFFNGAVDARAYASKAQKVAAKGGGDIDLGDLYASESKTAVNKIFTDLTKQLAPAPGADPTPGVPELQNTLEDARKASERIAKSTLNGDDIECGYQRKIFEQKCADAKNQHEVIVNKLESDIVVEKKRAEDARVALKTADAPAKKTAEGSAAAAEAQVKALTEQLKSLKDDRLKKIQSLKDDVYAAQLNEMDRFAKDQMTKNKQKILEPSYATPKMIATVRDVILKQWRPLNQAGPTAAMVKVSGSDILPTGEYTLKRQGDNPSIILQVNGDNKGNYLAHPYVDSSKWSNILRPEAKFRHATWEAHLINNAGTKKRPLTMVMPGQTGGETPEELSKRAEEFVKEAGFGPLFWRLKSTYALAVEHKTPLDIDHFLSALRSDPEYDRMALAKFAGEVAQHNAGLEKQQLGQTEKDQAAAEIKAQKEGTQFKEEIKEAFVPDAFRMVGRSEDLPAKLATDYKGHIADDARDGFVEVKLEAKSNQDHHVLNEINGIRAIEYEMKLIEERLKGEPGLEKPKIDELAQELKGLRKECEGLSRLYEDHDKWLRDVPECNPQIKKVHAELGKRDPKEPGKPSVIEYLNPQKLEASHAQLVHKAEERAVAAARIPSAPPSPGHSVS